MQLADTNCQQKGVRFTKLRQTVYRIILQAQQPIGAYDILSLMQQQLTTQTNTRKTYQSQSNQVSKPHSKNIAPPTVYRSLDFLLSIGLIHQLSSINAYIPCYKPREQHIAAFLICDNCHQVQECSGDAVTQLLLHTRHLGFMANKTTLEIQGICQNCQHQ